jgi:nitronate monooxygenase
LSVETKPIIKKIQFHLPRISLPKLSLHKINRFPVSLPELKIGNITSKLPIVQGGMAVCISLSNLASAVSREGGIGVIAATAIGMLEPDYFKNGAQANQRALRKEIRLARQKGAQILGVNIMVAASDFDRLLKVSIEEKVDIIFLGAGLPIKGIPVQEIRDAGVKIVPIVSSARAARLIFSHWQKHHRDIPDGVVVEGPLAGGHLGFRFEQIDDPAFSLERIIPRVTEEMRDFEKQSGRQLPVVAAGGIFSGKDIYRFFQLGANAVQLGTRFVATHECDADQRFKESFVKSNKKDLMIIKSPVGLPGRALRSPFLKRLETGKSPAFGCPWQCLASCNAAKANYCISMALYHARKGNLQKGFAFAGANAYKVKQMLSVGELISQLKQEFTDSIESGIFSLSKEYNKALKQFRFKKKEYQEKLRVIKKEYRKKLRQKHDSLLDDYQRTLTRIENLKTDYLKYVEKLREIAVQMDEIIKGNQAIPLSTRSQL